MVIGADTFLYSRAKKLASLTLDYGIAASGEAKEFVMAGGLMSYGTDYRSILRQIGVYAGRILKGEKPTDLPVQQPTRYELTISLKSAKALGLMVPQSLLARADEVIE